MFLREDDIGADEGGAEIGRRCGEIGMGKEVM
jgi:hypothetical protein